MPTASREFWAIGPIAQGVPLAAIPNIADWWPVSLNELVEAYWLSYGFSVAYEIEVDVAVLTDPPSPPYTTITFALGESGDFKNVYPGEGIARTWEPHERVLTFRPHAQGAWGSVGIGGGVFGALGFGLAGEQHGLRLIHRSDRVATEASFTTTLERRSNPDADYNFSVSTPYGSGYLVVSNVQGRGGRVVTDLRLNSYSLSFTYWTPPA